MTWRFDDATFDRSMAALDNPNYVDIVINACSAPSREGKYQSIQRDWPLSSTNISSHNTITFLENPIMKIASLITLGLSGLMFQSAAFALDSSAQVKVSTVLKTETSWDGKPIVYPSGKSEVSGLIVEIAPGAQTGWHLHPVPSFAFVLEGELDVEQKNGSVKHIKAGEAFAEVVNTLHNGRNVGTVPAKLVVFYAGAVGEKLTVKEGNQ